MKTNFIAEIASSHNGSYKNLKNVSNQLLKSNVDYIKFQIFKADELAHTKFKFYKILKKIELNKDFFKKEIYKALKKKKKIILEPFDDESFNFCNHFKSKVCVKISISEKDKNNWIAKSLQNFKLVFLSISGLTLNELIQIRKKYKNHPKLVYTYGFQSFPTKTNDLRLGFIKDLSIKGFKICYADHTGNKMMMQDPVNT